MKHTVDFLKVFTYFWSDVPLSFLFNKIALIADGTLCDD